MTNPTTNSTPKVLFVDTSAEAGGGQLSIERMLPHFSAVRPIIAFLNRGPVADRLTEAGCDVRIMAPSTRASTTLQRRFLSELILGARPDIVVALSTSVARTLSLVPRHGEVRLLRLSEDMDRYKRRGLKTLAYFGFVFRRFDGYIANSQWTATTVPDRLSRKRAIRVAYPTSGIAGSSNPLPPLFPTPAMRIITLSRPEPWKGLHLAIEACASVAQADPALAMDLTIYGGGHNTHDAYLRELEASAEQAPLPVRFAGHVDNVDEALSASDVLLVPSVIPEPFGQVIIQALAAGRLVIACDRGGPAEIIQDRVTGLTASTDGSSEFAQLILAVSRDRNWARSLATAGAKSATKFNDAHTIAAMEKAIIELNAVALSHR